nr:GUN4 domain-containing protein [Nostoc commune]
MQEFLAEQKWQEADKETYSTMLKICEREEEGWLDDGEIKRFPRHDLYIRTYAHSTNSRRSWRLGGSRN